MAKKQKKKRNKKYRQKYTTGGRLDMRSGGRVKLLHGGRPNPADYLNPDGTMDEIRFNEDMATWMSEHDVGGGGGTTETQTSNNSNKGEVDPNRQARVETTGVLAQEQAKGNINLDSQAVIDTPQKINLEDTIVKEGTGRITDAVERATKQDTKVAREQVTTKTADEATAPDAKRAREAQIQTVSDKEVDVDSAQRTTTGVGAAPQQTLTDTRDFAQAQIQPGSEVDTIDALLSKKAFAPDVVGQGAQVSETAGAERQTRESIVDRNAVGRNAAQILGTLGYDSVQRRTVTGTAAKGAAANVIAETANIPQNIAAAIVEDPATVEAQVDTNPVEVNAAIAALPTEALVSSQMETLLAGMEDGNIPLWARPAVDAVNQNMAARGMLPSTVGRDALFNAIVQSAFPMAQGNAQALQARAAQNLSNQQQANLQQATQEQQLRLQNLSNRQTAASQTAQFAQQMGVMQSQFRQEAVMTTAQQQQQVALQNLQNRQQAAVLQAQNQQALNAQELGNEQQINLAELQIEAQAAGADQSAENQERLVELQIAADFRAKNAAFAQDMDKANLSEETKIRFANLTA